MSSEEVQGKAVVDGALANDVKFFVFTSVDRGGDEKSYNNPTNVPHFISKHNIEHHLVDGAGSKMQWTILRPVAFMDNYGTDFLNKAMGTMFRLGLQGKKVQLVASKDIGIFAAKAFLNPDEYAGKGLSLAGDELNFNQIQAAWQQKTGTPFPETYGLLARGLMYVLGDVNLMFKFFVDEGYGADIPKLKKLHPGLLNWDEYLEQSPFVKKD